MLRSILSVVAGFAVIMLLIMPATILSARIMLGTRSREDMMTMTPTPAYMSVNFAFSALFAVVGGYVAAWIAGRLPIQHAAGLAALMFLMGIVSFRQNLKMKTSQGRVYSGTLVVLGPICALIGGWLRAMQG
jgi:hypothetical protein